MRECRFYEGYALSGRSSGLQEIRVMTDRRTFGHFSSFVFLTTSSVLLFTLTVTPDEISTGDAKEYFTFTGVNFPEE